MLLSELVHLNVESSPQVKLRQMFILMPFNMLRNPIDGGYSSHQKNSRCLVIVCDTCNYCDTLLKCRLEGWLTIATEFHLAFRHLKVGAQPLHDYHYWIDSRQSASIGRVVTFRPWACCSPRDLPCLFHCSYHPGHCPKLVLVGSITDQNG